jgi:hypothetical protein
MVDQLKYLKQDKGQGSGAPYITISSHPERTTSVIKEEINDYLSVTAFVTPTAEISYQWYSNNIDSNSGGTPIEYETDATFDIPNNLQIGVYYYFCEVSAEGATTVRSNVAIVNVSEDGTEFEVYNIDDWNRALYEISIGGPSRMYTINVMENVAVDGTTGYSFGEGIYLSVTIQGPGKLFLNNEGERGSIIRITSLQTLHLINFPLEGRPGNSTAVVYLYDGEFIMHGNASVSKNNSSGYGGGVIIENGSFTMHNSASINNNTALCGGGVFVDTNGTFTMWGNSKVDSNSVSSGSSGAGVRSAGTFKMYDNTSVQNNFNAETGGGVFVTDGSFNMSGDSSISNNFADSGAGVYIGGGEFEMNDDASVSRNIAKIGGGGIFIEGGIGELKMKGSASVSHNSAEGDNSVGGGVFITDNGRFTMESNTSIHNNKATDGGGVTIAGTASFTMQGKIHENEATNGGGVYLNGTTGSIPNFTMEDMASVYENIATNGGGVFVNDGLLSMEEDSEVHTNTAVTGGGVWVGPSGNGDYGILSMKNNAKIHNNTATGSLGGGGVYVRHQFYMYDSASVQNNRATNTNGQGGGVYVGTNSSISGDNRGATFQIIGGGIISDNTTYNSASGANLFITTDFDLYNPPTVQYLTSESALEDLETTDDRIEIRDGVLISPQ